jgi:hypothetical protein
MKKVLSIIIITLALFLTGCEKNRLVCTKTEEASNFKYDSKYVFVFNGESVKTATMTSTGTLSGDLNNKKSIEDYKVSAEEAAKLYNSSEGIEAAVGNKKNKVTLTVEIDPSKLSTEDKESYGVNLKKEDLKEELESLGYTCK